MANIKNFDSKKEYYTVKEIADILNVSRVTVFNKIKKGEIKAELLGKTYIIQQKYLKDVIFEELSDKTKGEIERGVLRVVKEYGETLKLLGKE